MRFIHFTEYHFIVFHIVHVKKMIMAEVTAKEELRQMRMKSTTLRLTLLKYFRCK